MFDINLPPMANKNNGITKSAASDIGTIRDILMGGHIAEYKAEFAAIRQKMADDRADLSAKLKASDKDTDARFAKLEKEMDKRFDRLEKIVTDNVARLDEKLLEISKADKQNLGQMLAEMSKKLTT